mmetsp:Transcript_1098/g.3474  ORF Transcript_1098/g.3474 Transcript_1098/m.3474 type:complete len:346 (-) Transcript_1098:111-1148(-)
MRHARLLVDGNHLAALRAELHARPVEPDLVRLRVAPNRDEHRVVDALGRRAVGELPRDALAPLSSWFDARGHGALNEGGAVLLHVLLHEPGHLLIKPAQRDRAHEHGCAHAEARDEASALERDVARANAQRLARRRGEGEDVVRADRVLLSPRNVRVARPAARGNHKARGRELGRRTLLVGALHGVRVLKDGVRVEVLDALAHELGAVAKVDRLDVHLHVLHHALPIVRARAHVPPKGLGVGRCLAMHRRLVHQLLGDAAHVDARAAETPLGANRRGLHEIAQRHLGAQLGRVLGAREAARAAADHDQVIVVAVRCVHTVGHCRRRHGRGGATISRANRVAREPG